MKLSPFHPFRSAQAKAEYHVLFQQKFCDWLLHDATQSEEVGRASVNSGCYGLERD